MPEQKPEELKARDAGNEAEGLAAASGGARRRRLLAYAALVLGSFAVSGLLALIVGGHFLRPPLRGLRRLPLLGRLIPPPPAPSEPTEEKVPTVADLHPMPAAEISELIQSLQKARDEFRARQGDLRRDEERLLALQLDLARERDRLDELMAGLLKRQADVEAQRKVLQAETLVTKAEERKRIAQLARIYEAQNPTSAATELAALDRSGKDGLAAKILAEMQEKKAAPIFDAMKAEAAVALKGKICQLRIEQDSAAKKQD